jgi:hypothetical protein
MDNLSLPPDVPIGNFFSLDPATGEAVQARARELAAIAGRTPQAVSQDDYEQAQRELTDELEEGRQEAMLDPPPAPSSKPDATGSQAPESASEDEDGEGRSESEQLVDQGAEEAEREQILQAARASGASDQREP